MGIDYELKRDRTLSNEGEFDTRIKACSRNKQTHSYSIQPLVSKDGKTIGKLLIVLQDVGDKNNPSEGFGPKIRERV